MIENEKKDVAYVSLFTFLALFNLNSKNEIKLSFIHLEYRVHTRSTVFISTNASKFLRFYKNFLTYFILSKILNFDLIINMHLVFVAQHYESKITNVSTGYRTVQVQNKFL